MGQILSLTPIQSETLQDSSLWETRQTKSVFCEKKFKKNTEKLKSKKFIGDQRYEKFKVTELCTVDPLISPQCSQKMSATFLYRKL